MNGMSLNTFQSDFRGNLRFIDITNFFDRFPRPEKDYVLYLRITFSTSKFSPVFNFCWISYRDVSKIGRKLNWHNKQWVESEG